MSEKLISLSPDLQRLRAEGYEIEIKGTILLVYNVPYVNTNKEISPGTLVCLLNISGEQLLGPADHTIYFKGDSPCDKDGSILNAIVNNSVKKDLGYGVVADHYFSAKPPSGNYPDYFEKIETYVSHLESQAQALNPVVTARTGKVIESKEQDVVFKYLNPSPSCIELEVVTKELRDLKVVIIGLGGAGSYILDFIAKTPVKEIHLFDGDIFVSKNAFRAPAAASVETLRQMLKKVNYYSDMYSNIHKHVVPHDCYVTPAVFDELLSMDFVFICIDKGDARKLIVQKLTGLLIPFIDVGMGVNLENGKVSGSVRTTLVTKEKNDHIELRIPFTDEGENEYNKNIQIVELNALNAAIAVIKWKKYFNFYHDLTAESHSIYETNVNKVIND
jgi:hypothetical protein